MYRQERETRDSGGLGSQGSRPGRDKHNKRPGQEQVKLRSRDFAFLAGKQGTGHQDRTGG